MNKKDMTFEEIKSDKEAFLRQYGVEELLPQCKIKWETLVEIGDDYEEKCYGIGRGNQEYKGEYFNIMQDYIAKIASFKNVHSYRFRIKKTGSLLAKLIRKSCKYDETYSTENYHQKITDLLGLRILYIFKEDYWPVHQQIMNEYGNQLAQDISIKLKAGDDRDTYGDLIRHSSNVRIDENETYRSIHYTLYAKKDNIDLLPRVEIQTRTIFEEGWSEINHKLVYKKDTGNQGLKKTSDVLSSMVGACDTIGMLMKTFYDTGVRLNNEESKTQENELKEEDNVVEVIRNFLRQ